MNEPLPLPGQMCQRHCRGLGEMLFTLHLAAVGLAALALWLTRHELAETAATRLDWALPAAIAIVVAAILLGVSPGKRIAFWVLTVGTGLALGGIAGLLLGKLNHLERDTGHDLLRMQRTWDGAGAAGLLLLLASTRFVTTDLLGRHSAGFGVLGALAALMAAYLSARLITVKVVARWQAAYANMARGEKRNPN
jgi:hypothetical protein